MANLIEYIQSQVYENSTEDISGSIMQQVLTRMASDEGVVNVHTISGQTPFADYNNAQAARDAVPAGFKKLGLIITYKLSSGWYVDEFIGSATSGWSTSSNWKCLGPISVSQNAETGKTTITIGSQSYDVATQPVSVSQNTLTIGGQATDIRQQFINVNDLVNKSDSYTSDYTAKNDVPSGLRKKGTIITFLLNGTWVTRQFISDDLTKWLEGSITYWSVIAPLNGYQYMGIATPTSTPETLNAVFYIAKVAGTYTNFGNITIAKDGLYILRYRTQWALDTLYVIDSTPTQSSSNLITSGAVKTALDNEKEERENEDIILEQTTGIYDREFDSVAGSYSSYDIHLESGEYLIKNTIGVDCGLRDNNNTNVIVISSTWTDWTKVYVTEQDSADIVSLRGLIGVGQILIKSASVVSDDVYALKISETTNVKTDSNNLYNGVYTYGYRYDASGNLVASPYYALTDKLNVYGHSGEYIAINSGIANPTIGHWVFEDTHGQRTYQLPQYRKCLIPNDAKYAISAIHCPNAQETDIKDVQINFGEVALNYGYDNSPLGGYDTSKDILNKTRYIDANATNDTFYITDINTEKEQKCYLRISGFDTPVTVHFYSEDAYISSQNYVGNQYRYITLPKGTARIQVSVGTTALTERRYYNIQITSVLSDKEWKNQLDKILSTKNIPPYPPRQTENFYDYPNFRTADIYAIYDAAMAKFPDYISRTDYGVDSSGQYHLFGYTIQFCEIPKYTILITCNIHGGSEDGDPVMGAYINTKLITDLIGVESRHNETINWLKNNVKLCVMPAANPWGIDNHSRINYNTYNAITNPTGRMGVNIGRNFPVSDWNDIPEEAGTNNYKGPSAGSEKETQAILQFVTDSQPDICIDNHTLGGVDGVVDANSGDAYIAFIKDQTMSLYNDYFKNVTTYYAKRDFAIDVIMPTTFYARGAFRDWIGEHNYLGGLIEMQWRDNLDSERGFTARIIEMSYFQLLSVFDYYRLYFS